MRAKNTGHFLEGGRTGGSQRPLVVGHLRSPTVVPLTSSAETTIFHMRFGDQKPGCVEGEVWFSNWMMNKPNKPSLDVDYNVLMLGVSRKSAITNGEDASWDIQTPGGVGYISHHPLKSSQFSQFSYMRYHVWMICSISGVYHVSLPRNLFSPISCDEVALNFTWFSDTGPAVSLCVWSSSCQQSWTHGWSSGLAVELCHRRAVHSGQSWSPIQWNLAEGTCPHCRRLISRKNRWLKAAFQNGSTGLKCVRFFPSYALSSPL